MFQIQEISAKSILSKSKVAGVDYSINPYIGCRFGCIYCYASFMGRSVGKNINDWGNYVFVKINAPQLLQKEIRKIPHQGKGKEIWFSSVTDPYQGIELKYKITRQCLQVLVESDYQGTVSFLTKSDLITRDIDLIKKLHKAYVGLTITSTDDKISRFFEKYAPAVSARLATLKKLNDNGLSTYAFLGPLFPHIIDDDAMLEQLFASVAQTGTKNIFVEYFNPSKYIVGRLKDELKADKKTLEIYLQSKNKAVRQSWDKKIFPLVKKYCLKLQTGSTIYHLDN